MNVAAALARTLSEAPPDGVTAVYLFGSHAEGRAHSESDVDGGVLLSWVEFPTRSRRFDERVRLSAWISAELGLPSIDLVVLNDAPPGLARRVVTAGQRVFCADDEAARAFTRDTQLRAADLEPFLRRTRRTKLEAIAR